MTNTRKWIASAGAAIAAGMCLTALATAQEEAAQGPGVDHSECSLFGPNRDRHGASGLAAESRKRFRMSELTTQVVPLLAASKARYAVSSTPAAVSDSLIDKHLFTAMQAASVTPAPRTNDYEFCRRVTYDLIGRPPTPERLVQFVTNGDPNKRAAYVDELLTRPEWVDKWQMFFSDLFENTQNNNQVNRFAEGRDAFYKYLKESLAANKRYNVIATELISAAGGNSYEDGKLGFVLGGFVTGGPRTGQDIFDQLAANTSEKFLGIAHENCVLCHDGRGHLDPLSVWGRRETRLKSWQLAAFFSRTNHRRVVVNPPANPYYYAIEDNTTFRVDYPLNTLTGNRPERQPLGSIRNVSPEYPFANGGKPNPGENYRVALARLLTADIQFSRAAVNYIWKQFFVRGIVEPANQFDLMRLDPDNPPAEPWTIQPTNPALLNALAKDFADNGYNLKDLMRKIATSDAYQLSSRYEGTWKPEYEKLFARKFVRRLWGEEVMDTIVQTSNIANTQLNVPSLGGRLPWAMQLPDTFRIPAEPLGSFLDSFLRGNRIEEERRLDGSVLQALNLMNDAFVHSRTRASGAGDAASLARQLLTKYTATSNNLLVNEMFLTVLNRPATEEELLIATAAFARATTVATRQAQAEDLLWALYNKVDFVYNY